MGKWLRSEYEIAPEMVNATETELCIASLWMWSYKNIKNPDLCSSSPLQETELVWLLQGLIQFLPIQLHLAYLHSVRIPMDLSPSCLLWRLSTSSSSFPFLRFCRESTSRWMLVPTPTSRSIGVNFPSTDLSFNANQVSRQGGFDTSLTELCESVSTKYSPSYMPNF